MLGRSEALDGREGGIGARGTAGVPKGEERLLVLSGGAARSNVLTVCSRGRDEETTLTGTLGEGRRGGEARRRGTVLSGVWRGVLREIGEVGAAWR